MPKKPLISLVKSSSKTPSHSPLPRLNKSITHPIAASLQTALHVLLAEPGSLVPADAELLQTIWPLKGDVPSVVELSEALVELLAQREFRQVIVGRDAHIARVGNGSGSALVAANQSTSVTGAEQDSGEIDFDLKVALDVETERQLLFRVLVVLESIGALLLAREAALWWAGV